MATSMAAIAGSTIRGKFDGVRDERHPVRGAIDMLSRHRATRRGSRIAAATLIGALVACRSGGAHAPTPVDPSGSWEGTFTIGGQKHTLKPSVFADSAHPRAYVHVPDH